MDYISNNIILEVAYTEKGTVTKTSVAYALAMARAEAPVPEAYADDYAELKAAYDLAKKSEDSTKLIKEMDKELDEKARERYATLTDDEIMDLLVNKKWYYAIGTGINDLYAAISHQLADRIIELSKRYEDNQILPFVTGIKVSSISKSTIAEKIRKQVLKCLEHTSTAISTMRLYVMELFLT